ncbi:MAG: ATP-binding protein [Dermatophilaceae bacterium]
MTAPTRLPNPFRPGFARTPPVLVGRQAVLGAAWEALNVAALDGITPRELVLVGPRGVGKTVTLHEIASLAAETQSWPTVHVEVHPRAPFTPELVDGLGRAAHLLDHETQRRARTLRVKEARLSAGIFGVGAETTLEVVPSQKHVASAMALSNALTVAADVAIRQGAGLVITMDEIQLASRNELALLGAVLQQNADKNWPLVIVLAGLPTIRAPRRSVTYLERAEWHELGMVTDDQAVTALVGPALTAHRPMDADAAAILADAAGGYPYAIQVLGHHAWRASTGSSRIQAAHARKAVADANQDMSAGLYAGRWADATDKERGYLTALASLIVAGAPTGGGDVARALGVGVKDVSYLRDNLLKKGTLYTVGRRLRLVTPGMAEWVLSQTQD